MRYILLLGGNLGDVASTMNDAISHIASVCSVVKRSSIFESEPWGFNAVERFKNMAVEIETDMEPISLLNELQRIERLMGRKHKTVNRQYQSRTIDIDILLCDSRVVDTERLTIPHKLMHLRRFALEPVAEYWADWQHQVLNKSVGELLQLLE